MSASTWYLARGGIPTEEPCKDAVYVCRAGDKAWSLVDPTRPPPELNDAPGFVIRHVDRRPPRTKKGHPSS